jgi:hypothetical protein
MTHGFGASFWATAAVDAEFSGMDAETVEMKVAPPQGNLQGCNEDRRSCCRCGSGTAVGRSGDSEELETVKDVNDPRLFGCNSPPSCFRMRRAASTAARASAADFHVTTR